MSQLYNLVKDHEASSSPVQYNGAVLALLPQARRLALVPTYKDQLRPGAMAVVELGDSQLIAKAIADSLNATLEEKIEEHRFEMELEAEDLHSRLQISNSNNSLRARPFIEYAGKDSRYDWTIQGKVSRGEELSSKEIDAVASLVYPSLKQNAGATNAHKKAISDYIRTGQAESDMLDWFGRNIGQIFSDVERYLELRKSLDGANNNGVDLELLLRNAVDSIKSGREFQDIAGYKGSEINTLEKIEESLGIQRIGSSRFFAARMGNGTSNLSGNGYTSLFQYDASRAENVPEELKQYYIPIERYGRIVALFDLALQAMVMAYAKLIPYNRFSFTAARTRGNLLIGPSLMMRSVFPDDHEPTTTLYSEDRTYHTISKKDAAVVKAIVRENRREIPSAVAKHFGIAESAVRFEELIALQTKLMDLLPMPVYEAGEAYVRLQEEGSLESKMRELNARGIERKKRLESKSRILKRDFDLDFLKVNGVSKSTLEEALDLFGAEFEFVRKPFEKEYEWVD